jgi:hypothetical protein
MTAVGLSPIDTAVGIKVSWLILLPNDVISSLAIISSFLEAQTLPSYFVQASICIRRRLIAAKQGIGIDGVD